MNPAQLHELIKQQNTVDTTEHIRSARVSPKLKEEVMRIQALNQRSRLAAMQAGRNDGGELDAISLTEVHMDAMIECPLLHQVYPDLYHKVRKEVVNMDLLFQFLEVLRRVEDGELSQHDGAVCVGETLKEVYIDSHLRETEKRERAEREAEGRKATDAEIALAEAEGRPVRSEKQREEEKLEQARRANMSWGNYMKKTGFVSARVAMGNQGFEFEFPKPKGPRPQRKRSNRNK
jgi:hypothetical protein